MSRPRLSNAQARRVFLARHGLSGTRYDSAHAILCDLGFVQLDSINTVARAHHMILHARRTPYRDRDLTPMLAPRRLGFESWTHDASLIDMAHFPQWRLKFSRDASWMRHKWKDWHGRGYEAKCDVVLQQIADHGACSSTQVGLDETRSSGGWWEWHPSKTALEYLWRSGEIMVTRREGFRKVYDLTERVIPPQHLKVRMSDAEILEWACNAALDRLGFATPTQLARFWDLASIDEAKAWAQGALASGDIEEVEVEGARGEIKAMLARPGLLDEPPPEPPGQIRILSPFDPALRDRNRAEWLFGFFYRIEVFVPEAKRRYGYYVFPVLEGDRLIGRIDMSCERAAERLSVRAFWPEPRVKLGTTRRARLEAALERTARFAGTPELSFAPGWERETLGA